VQIYTCNSGNNQQWTVTPGPTGDTIQALRQCLDVQGAGTANGTLVQIYTCNSTAAQVWVPVNGELINPNSGRCLDDPGSSTTNGTQLQIYDCNQTTAQKWEFSDLQQPATGPVTGVYGKCVDVRGGGAANTTPVQIFGCNGGNNQQWTVTPGPGGDTLQALGQCLDVTGGGTANGTLVEIFTCNGGGAQEWVPYGGALINPHSGRCLDDPGSRTTNGTQLQIYDCDQSNAQNWQLPGPQPAPGPIFGIQGTCIQVNGSSGHSVESDFCNGAAAEQWTVIPGSAGDTLRAQGMCLDVQGGGTANGTLVQIFTCHGGADQVWVPVNGELINPNSGRCLDDPGSSLSGPQLQIYDCNQTTAQKWELAGLQQPATGPVTGIYGKCVDVRGGGTGNGTPVDIYTCNGGGAQQWTATPGPAGDTLQALGQCLDVQGAGTYNGTLVENDPCNGGIAQQWVPYGGALINPFSGRCLDDPGSTRTDSTQLQIYKCNQTNAQNWQQPF
jgi:nitrite reductase/ring-hydroxylating ferredoxin subunit